jgi:chaperone modulatory protein CbpM
MANVFEGRVVEEEIRLTLTELCRACGATEHELTVWVSEGVIEPEGEAGGVMQFGGASLRRARRAAHLARDLEINPAGVALALDLLDEIEALRSRLARLGEN